MKESIFLIVGSNVLLLALLLLILLFSRLHWILRLFLVLIVSGSYWLTYQGWDRARGWPSSNPLPEKFLLHGAVIEEPNQAQGLDGTIFVWATDLDSHQPAEQPRAYILPYSEKLHGAAQEALRHMRNGELQLGTVRSKPGTQQQQGSYEGEVPLNIEFSNLPKQALPEK